MSLASPYLIGTGIGLLETFAFGTAKRGLGVTTPFESVAALAGRKLAPDLLHVNAYVKERDEAPKLDWEAFMVLGIAGGSYLAARATSKRRRDPSSRTRMLASFVGGALVMFGARMAKGCTSGHGITGMLQLALSSWVFTPIMFATSVGVARLVEGEGR